MDEPKKPPCSHPRAYTFGISADKSLAFYVCPDCGADWMERNLGDMEAPERSV